MGKTGRNAKEVEQVVVDFERSGLSRRDYCQRRGIALPTLDWYRRRVRASRLSPGFVPVKLAKPTTPVTSAEENGFTLVLVNGNRIESTWSFDETQLARLIRVAGAV